MFQTNPRNLRDLLNDAHEGRLQLPDFQRSYVWGDEDIQNLIASVAKGYPIGAFLSLQTGGEVRFKPRLLEGVNGTDSWDSPTSGTAVGRTAATHFTLSGYLLDGSGDYPELSRQGS